MFNNIDLRELAQISGPERAFLSLYLANKESYGGLKGRIDTLRALLKDDAAETEHFEENLKIVEKWLSEHTWETDGVCLFVCWALDYRAGLPADRGRARPALGRLLPLHPPARRAPGRIRELRRGGGGQHRLAHLLRHLGAGGPGRPRQGGHQEQRQEGRMVAEALRAAARSTSWCTTPRRSWTS